MGGPTQAAPPRFSGGIALQHNSSNFPPVRTFGFGVEEPQIQAQPCLIIRCELICRRSEISDRRFDFDHFWHSDIGHRPF
ncbi:hypothetical protein ATN00_02155 [Sphingobium baderi]|uniref:Uncharacterized protein n=1 Tax=Sphingobium baderi TaxID=1332080 RepID=A0A0S3EV68_9SPHN|nr:hypothetical protein ATN00_02155 [Sphingobium baderi]